MEVVHATGRLVQQSLNLIDREEKRLEKFDKLKTYAEPSHILKLGFSISRFRGEALKDSSSLSPGDLIETELNKGKIKSKVTDIEKKLYIRKSKKRTG